MSKSFKVISHETPRRERKNEAHSLRSCVIGVLDIQGSVKEHMAAFYKLGIKPIKIKTKEDLDKIDGLVIPGGESTTIGQLMKLYGLDKEIIKRAQRKNWPQSKPLSVWGTCAGAILLAKKITGKKPDNLGLMNIEIERNAYGRQTDSFETEVRVAGIGFVPAVFIRAPIIKKASLKAKILAKYEGSIVMVRQNNLLATTFHPELTKNLKIHKYFVSLSNSYAHTTDTNGKSDTGTC